MKLTTLCPIFVSVSDGLSWEDYEDAWGLLDVAGQEVNDGDDAHKALESYAARGSEEAARAGLALALAVGDGLLDSTWTTDWTRARVHLEFLERHGYVLSDAERLELGQAAGEENGEVEAGE